MSEQEKRIVKQKRGRMGGLMALPLLVAGGWILYSRLVIDHEQPLPEAIRAKRVVFNAKVGANISYYVDRRKEGRPLVLIHGVSAVGSAYEVAPLFEHYRNRRPVYALELPGFGFSERPARTYTPQYFAEAILDFLEGQVQEAADVIAVGLSSEFAARAASAQPERFNSLVLISPTGLGAQAASAARVGEDGFLMPFLNNPMWSQSLFDLMVTRRAITYNLRPKFVGPIPAGFVDYAYATAHQPGAHYAPLAQAGGQLSTPDVASRFYNRLTMPTLIIYDRDPAATFEKLPVTLDANVRCRAARIVPSLGLPHFTRLVETAKALDAFWGEEA